MNNIITLPELITKLAATTSTTNRMSELFLREMFATISQALLNGESVTIKDFGQFKASKSSDGHYDVVFKPSKQMAETLNQPFDAFIPVEIDDDINEEMLNGIDNNEDNNKTDDTSSLLMPPPFHGEDTTVESDEPQVTQEVGESEMLEEPSLIVEDHEPMISEQADYEEDQIEDNSNIQTEPQPVLLKDNDTTNDANDEELFLNNEQNSSKRSFLQGLAAGAIGMLILSAIGWWLIGRNSSSQADSSANGDTIAAMTDSADIAKKDVTPVVTDTTSATMYLSKIARKHYGRAEFWVYIYEENSSIIKDPNNIPPGTVVVIPPAEKYGIDANDKESINRANKRSFELFSKGTK